METARKEMSKQCPWDESEIFDKFRKTGCFKYLTSPILAASRCGDYYGPNTNYYETSQDFISPWRYEYIKRKSKYHKYGASDEVHRNLWIATGKSGIVIPDIAAKWYADQQKLQKLLTDIRKLSPEEALLYRQYLYQNQSLFSALPLECLDIKPPIRNWINVDEKGSTNYMSPEFFELLRKHNESMNQLYNLNAHLPKYRSRELEKCIESLRPTSSLDVTLQKFCFDEESRNVAKGSKKTVSEPLLGKKKKTLKSMGEPHLRGEIWKKTDELVMRDSEASRPVKPTYLKKKVRKGGAEQDSRKIKMVRLPIMRRHSERGEQPFFKRGKSAPHYQRSVQSIKPPSEPYKIIWEKPRIFSQSSVSPVSKQHGSEKKLQTAENKKYFKKGMPAEYKTGLIKTGYGDEDKKNMIKELEPRDGKTDLTELKSPKNKRGLARELYSGEDRKILKKASDEHKKELTKEKHVFEDKDDLKKEQRAVEAKRDVKKEPRVEKLISEPRTDEDKKDSTRKLQPDGYKKDLSTGEHSLIPKGLGSALLKERKENLMQGMQNISSEEWEGDLRKEKYTAQHKDDSEKNNLTDDREEGLRKEPHKEGLKRYHTTPKRISTKKRDDLELPELEEYVEILLRAKEQKKSDFQIQPRISHHAERKRETYLKKELLTDKHKEDLRKELPSRRRALIPKESVIEPATHEQKLEEVLRTDNNNKRRTSTLKESGFELAKPEQNVEKNMYHGKHKKKLKKRRYTAEENGLLVKKRNGTKHDQDLESDMLKAGIIRNEALMYLKRELSSVKREEGSKKESPPDEYREPFRKESDDEKEEFEEESSADDHKEDLEKELPVDHHKEQLRKESPADDHKQELKEELPANDLNEKLKEESSPEEYEQELKKELFAEEYKEDLKKELSTEECKEDLKKHPPTDKHEDDLKKELFITSLKRKESSYHLIRHKHKIDFKKSCAQTTRRHQKDLKIKQDVADECLISSSEMCDSSLVEKISPYTSLHECQRAFFMINDFGQQIEKFTIKSSRRPKRFLRPADACPWPMIYPKIKAVQRDPCYQQSDNSFTRYQKAAQRVKLDLEEARRNGFLTCTSLKHMDFDCKMCNVRPQTVMSCHKFNIVFKLCQFIEYVENNFQLKLIINKYFIVSSTQNERNQNQCNSSLRVVKRKRMSRKSNFLCLKKCQDIPYSNVDRTIQHICMNCENGGRIGQCVPMARYVNKNRWYAPTKYNYGDGANNWHPMTSIAHNKSMQVNPFGYPFLKHLTQWQNYGEKRPSECLHFSGGFMPASDNVGWDREYGRFIAPGSSSGQRYGYNWKKYDKEERKKSIKGLCEFYRDVVAPDGTGEWYDFRKSALYRKKMKKSRCLKSKFTAKSRSRSQGVHVQKN
uniref:Uncharacterized protein n=2 Tax=Glossina austeni TaxID=7395 RepID=A0A1A9UGL2_GLOAU